MGYGGALIGEGICPVSCGVGRPGIGGCVSVAAQAARRVTGLLQGLGSA